jgi:hypothetical protein
MPSSSFSERGVAALTLTWLLLLAALLAAGYAQRGLVAEQRTSASQYRAAQVHAAAEAGIDWVLAQLNGTGRVDRECRASNDVTATTFRERYLQQDVATATYRPTSWIDAGIARPLMPSCVRAAAGWRCSCPNDGPPDLAADDDATVAFALQLHGDAQPGIVRLVSAGCDKLPCTVDASEAGARVEVAVALLPALRSAPVAALTARGSIDADSADFGAHNQDPLSGGVALHAGGAIHASRARLSSPAGAVSVGQSVAHDAALAALDAERYFAAWFGLDRALWRRQAVVHALTCNGDCAAQLAQAIDAGATLIGVEGDLLIEGPVTLGSTERPVLIVAHGVAQLHGAVALTGVLYAAEIGWNVAASGAWLRGAAISAGGYGGNGSPELIYDPAVLERLMRASGGFVRVPGSWRDF